MALYTQRDATSQYYFLLGKGMGFPRTRLEGTWRSGNMVPHRGIDKVPTDTTAGGLTKHTEYSNLLWVLSG